MAALVSKYAATVKGGFFAQYSGTLAGITSRSSVRSRVAQALGRRGAMVLREVMDTLNGVAPGQTASKTLGRIANSTELGGQRTIETQTLVSAATAVGDVTEIAADILTYNSYDSTPVANLDGNASIMRISH